MQFAVALTIHAVVVVMMLREYFACAVLKIFGQNCGTAFSKTTDKSSFILSSTLHRINLKTLINTGHFGVVFDETRSAGEIT